MFWDLQTGSPVSDATNPVRFGHLPGVHARLRQADDGARRFSSDSRRASDRSGHLGLNPPKWIGIGGLEETTLGSVGHIYIYI